MDGDLVLHELTIDGFHGALRGGELAAVQLVIGTSPGSRRTTTPAHSSRRWSR